MKTNEFAMKTIYSLLLLSASNFALAQAGGLAEPLTDKLETVQTALTAVGGIAVTIALVWVGMKMAFQGAEWKDVSPVFWGGVLIGGAAIIGRVLIA